MAKLTELGKAERQLELRLVLIFTIAPNVHKLSESRVIRPPSSPHYEQAPVEQIFLLVETVE
jgi:hypothetical protein